MKMPIKSEETKKVRKRVTGVSKKQKKQKQQITDKETLDKLVRSRVEL